MLKRKYYLFAIALLVICFILAISISNGKKGYYKYSFEYDSHTYSNVHVYETTPKKQKIAPAVYVTGNKQILESMTPTAVETRNIVARTNAGVMEVAKDATAFYGLYYVYNTEEDTGYLYMDGMQLGLLDDMETENSQETYTLNGIKYIGAKSPSLDRLHAKYYPSFCVLFDGSTDIVWFTKDSILQELPKYECIIGACHPLVYQSKSVFDEVVFDAFDNGVRIADWDDLYNPDYRYNEMITHTSKLQTMRTLLGHKSDGAYIMVVVEDLIDLRMAAYLMQKLGCDFAVNLDGSVSSQMWLSDRGKVTSITNNKNTYYGTAIVAYNQ